MFNLTTAENMTNLIGKPSHLRVILESYALAAEKILDVQKEDLGHQHLACHFNNQFQYLKNLYVFSKFINEKPLKYPTNIKNFGIYDNGDKSSINDYLCVPVTRVDLFLNQFSYQRKSVVTTIFEQLYCIEKRIDEHRVDIGYIQENIPRVFNDKATLDLFILIDKYIASLFIYIASENPLRPQPQLQIRQCDLYA